MDYRQAVIDSVNHRQGPLAIDFGATGVTGIHVSIVEKLRELFGLSSGPVKVIEPYQMLGEVADDLLDAMGAAVVGLPSRGTLFGFVNENFQPWRTPWGQEVLVSEHFRTTTKADGQAGGGAGVAGGGLYVYPCGDISAPPCAHMPEGGYFFDTLIRQEPIDEDNLNPADNLEEFKALSLSDLEHYRAAAVKARASGRAVVGGCGGTAFGDIALVPGPYLKYPKGIRDVTEWYMSTVMRPDYIHAVFSAQCDIALQNLEKYHQAVGDNIDILYVCGTDFGTQQSTFCSGETFDNLFAPYYRRVNNWVHTNTSWKTFKHSCGAIEPFIDKLIDVGFDILNPVQCSAVGMEPEKLKEKYGSRVCFWGGGVDTQHTLPFGKPQEVKDEVRRRCEIFSPGGGFVFNTIHNTQAMTPIKNLAAMFEALDEFRK